MEQQGYDDIRFILDGHHKLIAYKNLNINPLLVTIYRCLTQEECNSEFDDEIKKYLLPNQVDYIFNQ